MQNDSLKAHWDEKGYIAVNNLLTTEETSQLLKICNRIKQESEIYDHSRKGKNPETYCIRHLNHPEYFVGRLDEYQIFMNSVCLPKILNIVEQVLGNDFMYRCTSYFTEPKSGITDGNWHRDIQFIHKDENKEKEEFLKLSKLPSTGLQLQIALEPSEDVEYVPYTHKRWDTQAEYDIRLKDNCKHNRSNNMPNALRFHQNPGDMVAFDPNGLHRGRYHSDKIRRTLMLTYSTVANYDFFTYQPWFLDDPYFKFLPESSKKFYSKFISEFENKWSTPYSTSAY